MQKYHKPMAEYPSCIKECLPRAESTVSDNLEGHVLSGEKCQVVFWEVKRAFFVGEHSHPHAEWGIVVSGSCELTINGETKTYFTGQEFYVPPGEPHISKMSDNYRSVDFFGAADWVKVNK